MSMTKRKLKTGNQGLKTSRTGWLVWTWSKVGSLIVFTGMTLMLLTAYSFISASGQSDGANQLSRSLRNGILDTYDSTSGMSFEYELPGSMNGEAYSLEILDKSGDTAGIIVRARSGVWEVTGGSSLAVPMSDSSFGVVKSQDEELHYICIVKDRGKVYIERSRC